MLAGVTFRLKVFGFEYGSSEKGLNVDITMSFLLLIPLLK